MWRCLLIGIFFLISAIGLGGDISHALDQLELNYPAWRDGLLEREEIARIEIIPVAVRLEYLNDLGPGVNERFGRRAVRKMLRDPAREIRVAALQFMAQILQPVSKDLIAVWRVPVDFEDRELQIAIVNVYHTLRRLNSDAANAYEDWMKQERSCRNLFLPHPFFDGKIPF